MAGFVTPGIAGIGMPAGALGAVIAGGIQPQAGDDGEGVAGAGVNGDPVSATALAVAQEVRGLGGRGEDAGSVQGEGNGAGAIVAVVGKGAVAAAPLVRH